MQRQDTVWLLPFFREIKQRPGMYLGHENARLLWQFLAGFRLARKELGFTEFGPGEPDHLTGFSEWLRARSGQVGSSIPWYELIEQLDPSERNLGTFFREFEEYLRANDIDLDAVEPWLPESMRIG